MKFIITFFFIAFALNFLPAQEYQKMISKGTYTVQEIQAKAETHFAVKGKGKGTGYKQYKRWEYHALRTMDTSGVLKTPAFYVSELQRYTAYKNQSPQLQTEDTTGDWVELGPTSWDNSNSGGWNPGVGRVTSIAIEEGNTNHIIIGANTGGVWKTTDGGTTWSVLTDELSNLNVSALEIDPFNASVYYWGSSSGVIFKSLDAGATWNILADVGDGYVNKIMVDPANSTKMYCTAQYGGIFKSVDSGVTWTSIHSGATTGYDIEFKPGDSNVVYAAGNQLYKSTDAGNTFVTINDNLAPWTQEYTVDALSWVVGTQNQDGVVTPKTGDGMALFFYASYDNPVTKLVSTEIDLSAATTPELNFSYTNSKWNWDVYTNELRVLYKTAASDSWTTLATYTTNVDSWEDISIELPASNSTYYIAFEGTNNFGKGITIDDVSIKEKIVGTLYFEEGFELGENDFGSGAKMIGVSADNDATVYVLEEVSGAFGAIYKSVDNGETFQKLAHPNKNYFGYSSAADDNSGQAPRDMDIAVNPTDIDEVHIAGVNTWKSSDGGATFNITSQWTTTNATNQNIGYCHADVDILKFVGSTLYAGTDGGVFLANNTETVSTNYYTDITAGLGIRQFYKIGISNTNNEVITGGSQDNGTSVIYTGAGTWTDWLGADGMETFVDKNDENLLYGTSQNGSLYKSYNGGENVSWVSSPEDKSGNWVTPFEQDPIVQNTIYSGYDEVYKSIDGGDNWISISQNFGGNLNHLKIAPSNSAVQFAAKGDELYRTLDGGATDWQQKAGFSGSINAIAIHPTNPTKIALATTGNNKVYVSNDSGDSWVSYLYDLPDFSALALVWENNSANGLYVGMNYGVYYINATNPTNWLPFSNNLPNVEVSELEINHTTNMLYAGTYGRGAWRTPIYSETVGIPDFELENISVYPNPTADGFQIKWDKNDTVTVRVFDATGKLIYLIKETSIAIPLRIETVGLSSGTYYISINNENGVSTKKIILQ